MRMFFALILSHSATCQSAEKVAVHGDCASTSRCEGVVASSMLQVGAEHGGRVQISKEAPAEWGEELVQDTVARLNSIFESSRQARNEVLDGGKYECVQRTGDSETVEPCTPTAGSIPDAPKYLRLGFHDCVKYADGSGGCDGCMNFDGMFTKYNPSSSNPLPDGVGDGDNNNMALSADLLERIYVDPSFPPGHPTREISLSQGGQSRADLWALATLAAAKFGMDANNKVCDGSETNVAEAIGRPDLCLIAPNRSLRFFSGRLDCPATNKPDVNDDSKFYRRRTYESLLKENLPNANADGKTVHQYFEAVFGFSVRETVAIMGAHSYGKFHADTSLFKYDWTRGTKNLLNNEYYRIISLKKHLNKQTNPFWQTVGGPGRTTTNWTGALADTRWKVRAWRFNAKGGPFQWSHQYKRCPFCKWSKKKNTWKVKEPSNGGGDAFRSVHCCEECTKQPDDDSIDPTCFDWISQDEEALASDAGLYLDFSFDETTGRPLGCNFKAGGSFSSTVPDCPLQDLLSNDGKKMYEIVDEYAEDQNIWANDFIAALEKMLANGNADGNLREEYTFSW
eukprot:TRINITY_DN3419_c0_g1_i1.p1 TRINITY_DN3419_c0_g1~~TRINITY_DN3419_c0_g1_i1.p1  ORF type:complete len:567 (-),score=86.90 TRINITY_DN3419_c0_g1_i1:29-1729(-)